MGDPNPNPNPPHVLMLAYPAQGHVIPMMELAQTLAKRGLKITFVNSDLAHKRLIDALPDTGDAFPEEIRLVSIPDGLEKREDRNVPGKLSAAISRVMPGKLEQLIREIGDEVTCLIADQSLGWGMEVGKKLGLKCAAFLPAAAAMRVLGLSIPKLIEQGIVKEDGTPVKNEVIQLSPSMPAMKTTDLVWARFGSLEMQKAIFEAMVKNNESGKLADRLICNSTYSLEPGAFAMAPEIIPIGPLLARNRHGDSGGHFWPEDSTCLKWLDRQATQSVIYVAFGSLTTFNQTQFQELALGLELTNRPFLWVVQPDITDRTKDWYPEGFLDRVRTRGKMSGWAPQQKVLSHPSVACFVSHCGWNSVMEGVSNGVPFLCWPYFADQFINQTYVCDVWMVGLGFERDEWGIVRGEEIQHKVEKLLGHTVFRERVLQLKEETMASIAEGGCSNSNFNSFLEWIEA
ncbi:UDP-glycosyltransferase 83A1-like [Diospyros lotus]|uniref:UDP-glycosyltransferase 83A1-like n=1 Tax=Diospyros lotus TaxID=55363 RepID=UPI00225332C8|nr:UDP-glycosyltransferase 83A1-like [Diospyros lotus]